MRVYICSVFLFAITPLITFGAEPPKELSGRWTWAERKISQSFSLESIQKTDETTFSATLTWWTINSTCAIRSQPISGQLTPTGLSFKAVTKCDDAFEVDLIRGETGWSGKATNKAKSVVVDVTAN
jgi:hypothetical protein